MSNGILTCGNCGNTSDWRAVTIRGSKISATCGSCGRKVTT